VALSGVVVADRRHGAFGLQLRRRHARGKEAGHSEKQGMHCARLIDRSAEHPVDPVKAQDTAGQCRADRFPEFAEPRNAPLRRVAGNERRVYGPDGNAGDPVGLKLRLLQRLEHATLISAQRAATLQHEHAFFAVCRRVRHSPNSQRHVSPRVGY
jgi:hypothetical protein